MKVRANNFSSVEDCELFHNAWLEFFYILAKILSKTSSSWDGK